MHVTVVAFAGVAAIFSLCDSIAIADETPAAALRALEGSWDVVAIEISGNKVKLGNGGPDKIVIKGGKLTIMAKGKPFAIFKEGGLELDPNHTPQTIDISLPRDVKVPGVYELNDKGLKLAIPKAPKNSDSSLERPDTFETKGKSVMLLVAKRSKE